MGIQKMNSDKHPFAHHDSWLGLKLSEVENHLRNMGKSLGSMSVDELLKNIWTSETAHSSDFENHSTSSSASLQRQASWSLAKAFSGKTVNELWKDIQHGCKIRNSSQESVSTLGEMTLEDFLVQSGMFITNASIQPVMSLDSALKSHKFSSETEFSPSPSKDALLVPSQEKGSWQFEKSIERRLRRKIKNRESAARSRARKQAYHHELVTKVSHLEEENLKLKKEKEFDEMIRDPEPRHQLRRTSSL